MRVTKMATTTHGIHIEEEIGAYMIAITAILLLRMDEDRFLVRGMRSSSSSSVSLSSTFSWRESVAEEEMTCNDIALKVNGLRRGDEVQNIFVDSLALEHGISYFAGKLREIRRDFQRPSVLGFRWLLTRDRNNRGVPGFGSRPSFNESKLVKIVFNRKELIDACGILDISQITLLEWIYIIKNKLIGDTPNTGSATTLVDLCTPYALVDSLTRLGSSSLSISSNTIGVQTEDQTEEDRWEEFMSTLKERLLAELVALRATIKIQHATLEALVDDDEYMNHLHDAMWKACIRDAGVAETWFQIFFWGSVSPKEKKIFHIVNNPDYIKELKNGVILSQEDLHNKLSGDNDNSILASKIRLRELFCDFMLQMMLHANAKSTVALEWMMLTTRCLKDSHTSATGMDYVAKLFMSNSNTTATDSNALTIQTAYKESIAILKSKINESKMDTNGNVHKRYLPVGYMDNYAVVSYAEETKLITVTDLDGTQHKKRIKKFASTNDSLSLMAKMVPRRYDLSNDPNRAGACVDLRELDSWLFEKVKVTALNPIGKFDLENSMDDPLAEPEAKIKWLKGEFCHLSSLTMLGSVPAKSSAHAQIAQVLKMVLNNFLDGGVSSESITPADPEFILQAIVYSVTLYDEMIKNNVFSIPPFHCQKHLDECLEKQLAWQRFLKTSFSNAISFKPSIFSGLNDRIDKTCIQYKISIEGPVLLPHQEYGNIPDLISISENEIDEGDSDDEIIVPTLDDDEDEPLRSDVEAQHLLNTIESNFENYKISMKSCSEIDPNLIESLTKIIVSRQTSMRHAALEVLEKVKPKQSRQVLAPLSVEHTNYEMSVNEIIRSTVTNHQRLKFNSELMFAVFEHANEAFQSENNGRERDIWKTNALTRLAFDFFNEQLRLCVEPFNLLNGDGYIQPLYECLPTCLKMFLVGKKKKIAKAGIFLLAQSVWAVEKRPDVMRQIAEIGPSLNEVLIEYHNASVARRLALLRVGFQAIRDASVNVGRIRCFYRAIKKLFETENSKSQEDSDEDESNEQDENDLELDESMNVETTHVKLCTQPGYLESTRGNSRKRKRESGSSSKLTKRHLTCREPEQTQQIHRFRFGGNQYQLVVLLSEYWLQPMVRNMTIQQMSVIQENVLDSYRPLESEQLMNLSMELENFKNYCAKVAKKENAAKDISKTNADGSPKVIPDRTILNELEYFIEKQTVDKTLKPLFNYISYSEESDVRTQTPSQKCPSKKPLICAAVVKAFEIWVQTHNGTHEDAINKIKTICRSHAPPIEFKNEIFTKEVRENFAKSAALKCSFSYVYKQGPDEQLSEKLMSELLWDQRVQLPYNLKGSVALVSEDEGDNDDED